MERGQCFVIGPDDLEVLHDIRFKILENATIRHSYELLSNIKEIAVKPLVGELRLREVEPTVMDARVDAQYFWNTWRSAI